MSGTDYGRIGQYLEVEKDDVSVCAAIALVATMGTQPFVHAWKDAVSAQAAITGLRFPKVDANELKPFVEPLSIRFPKVDANELKPFPSESEIR